MSYTDVKVISASKYFKFEANIPRDLRILDLTPVETFKHQAKKGQVLCTGVTDGCQWCLEGDIPRQRLLTNVYDYESQRVLIWEFGKNVMKALQAIEKTLNTSTKITDVDLRVEATGDGFDRKYTVTPLINSKTPPANIKLHKLGADLPF